MNMHLQWFPLFPIGLALSLGAALLTLLAIGSWLLARKSVPRRWVIGLGLLRVGIVVVFILGLLRPVFSLPRKVTLSPELLVLVDVSQSMGRPSAVGARSRLDEVRRMLRTSPAIEQVARTHSLQWFAFDTRAYPLEIAALDEQQPSGDNTELASSLASALQQAQLRSANLGVDQIANRVLLVSDGVDRGSADVVGVANELGLVVDVLAPAAGEEKARPTAVIADVQCARRVLLGSETALLVTIRADSAADDLEIVLEDDGREVDRQQIGALPAGHETRIELRDHPLEPGLKRYIVRLLQGGGSIATPRAASIQVADQRHEVLILEDSWRWDFKFLRRLLEDDPSFSFTAFLARGGTAFVQFGEPERRVQLGGFPHSRGELDGFDTLIIGDVNPLAWPRGFARHVHNAVAEGGKSLVVMAGPRLSNWSEVIELTRLLPVELNRESGSPISGPIELRVTPEGEASNWFSLIAGPGEPSERAARTGATSTPRLPPLEQIYPVLRKRPAASVLLEAAAQNNAYGPLIVMAEHTVGRGRVLFIGTDTLWRWQTLGRSNEAGVTLYGAFWQQALRALAPAESTTSSNELWLRPERTLYRAGDRVKLSAEWRANERGPYAAVTAAVVLPDGGRLPLELVPDRRDPGHLVAQFDVTLPGQYAIEASARTERELLADITTVVEAEPRPTENDDAMVDSRLLARLAAATGGRVIDPSVADGWLPAAPPSSSTVVKRQSFDLWHNFALVLLLCALLAADWSLRLFRGFV